MNEGPTGRELEVAALVAAGKSNREIAAALNVETSTVETHVHHLLARLGLRSRVDLALWWERRAKDQ